MLIIRSASEMETFVANAHKKGQSIGFVPTMGALHAGHISLVERAVAENDVTVVSVFVNPTQFNNPDDLATYPRDEESDFKLLAQAGISVAFAPQVDEIYPGGVENRHKKTFNLGFASSVMEGKYRPGHFQGVAEVVSRLFGIVRPTRAYFGEKDWQQIAVIKAMVSSLGLRVNIVECPIIRDEDGLARSSRNTLLSPDERLIAPEIYKVLSGSISYSATHTVADTHDFVVEKINSVDGLEVEYFSIVDGDTLQDVLSWDESEHVVGCITVYCGKTPIRLIDHIKYK